jgi:hypothetical protein
MAHDEKRTWVESTFSGRISRVRIGDYEFAARIVHDISVSFGVFLVVYR